MKGLIITGTDTGVGKTIASAILLAHLSKSQKAHYHKPIQTGLLEDNDALMVASLTKDFKNLTTSLGQGFLRPLSPHLAAFYENRHIHLNDVLKDTHKACRAEINLIEGAGGLLVPLNFRHLIADLFKALDLSCVLVARSKVGTINHTLLSIEALKARRIPLAGIIMMGERRRDTEESIKFFSHIDNILSIPYGIIGREFISYIIDSQASKLEQFLNKALKHDSCP